jgi:FAD/FMN-containing dehydrogenase
MHAYDAVTTKAGRYVQGGGCTTVGVAGLIQSGGFGSFSKNYGLAAAGLLEAEVVTADGAVRIANACTNPDLFWGIKGGGGGSLGVVTRVTLRTRELPDYFGGVFGTIRAKSDTAAADGQVINFYDRLFNRHWATDCFDRATPSGSRWFSRGWTDSKRRVSGAHFSTGWLIRLGIFPSRRR